MSHSVENGASPQKESKRKGKSLLKLLIAFLVIAGLVAGGYFFFYPDNKSPVSSKQSEVNPGKKVVLPAGKNIEELGGWKRVSPPENEPVFAYLDKIGSVQISVSQQQIPKTFKNNTEEKVAELAKGYNATKKIEAGNIVAYIGTSAKGPQSVIFTKDDLLILMKSTSKIEDEKWAKYIKTLDSPSLKNVPKY